MDQTDSDKLEEPSQITIYKHPILVPALSSERFQKLQKRIQARHQLIKKGQKRKRLRRRSETKSRQRSLWRQLLKSDKAEAQNEPVLIATPMSFEERFEELGKLVQDYEAMIKILQQHKASYKRFFRQLTDEVRLVVQDKRQKFVHIEEKRLALENEAQADADDTLLLVAQNQREQLLRSIRVLGQATLLLLKKLDLFKASLDRLAEDQGMQKRVLDKMVKRMGQHYKAYQLQKEINQLEQEVAEMANIAVHFETYMREYMGPFQDLIEQVTQIDGTLFSAVEEIKQITDMLVNEETGTLSMTGTDQFHEHVLEFLIQSNLKRERLVEVFEEARWERASLEQFELEMAERQAGSGFVMNALNNIQTLIEVRLPQQSENQDEAEISIGLTELYEIPSYTNSSTRLRSEPMLVSRDDMQQVSNV